MARDDVPSTRELINNYISLAEKNLEVQAEQARQLERLSEVIKSKLWWIIYILIIIIGLVLGVNIKNLPLFG